MHLPGWHHNAEWNMRALAARLPSAAGPRSYTRLVCVSAGHRTAGQNMCGPDLSVPIGSRTVRVPAGLNRKGWAMRTAAEMSAPAGAEWGGQVRLSAADGAGSSSQQLRLPRRHGLGRWKVRIATEMSATAGA